MHRGDCSFCTKLLRKDLFTIEQFPVGALNEDFHLLVKMLTGRKVRSGDCMHSRTGVSCILSSGQQYQRQEPVLQSIRRQYRQCGHGACTGG